MFDIGWQELFIIALLAIIVVGPKDLPRAIRTVTGWLRRARAMAREFQNGLDDVVREAELEDIKKEMDQASEFDITKAIESNVDPDGEIAKELDLDPLDEAGNGPLDETGDGRAESYEPDDGLDDDEEDEDGEDGEEDETGGEEPPEAQKEAGKVT